MREPLDYQISIMCWAFITPHLLTMNSRFKWVRLLGAVLCLPWVLTWIISFIPVVIISIVLLIMQVFKDV